MSPVASDVFDSLRSTLAERIMYFDGGMGTMIQQLGLEESDFRGEIALINNPLTSHLHTPVRRSRAAL